MFKFSPHGIKNPEIFQQIYADFIAWCKTFITAGTFSTYCDGEPVCFAEGMELSYRTFLNTEQEAQS